MDSEQAVQLFLQVETNQLTRQHQNQSIPMIVTCGPKAVVMLSTIALFQYPATVANNDSARILAVIALSLIFMKVGLITDVRRLSYCCIIE